jgi:hypothetical protein
VAEIVADTLATLPLEYPAATPEARAVMSQIRGKLETEVNG